MTTYELIEQYGYVALFKNTESGKYTVVQVGNNQVYSFMPGDMPKGGGKWVANYCDAGIAYVSGNYSRNYARKIYNQEKKLIQEEEQEENEMIAFMKTPEYERLMKEQESNSQFERYYEWLKI